MGTGIAVATRDIDSIFYNGHCAVWNLVSAAGGSIDGTTSSSFGSVIKFVAGSGVTLSGGSAGISIIVA